MKKIEIVSGHSEEFNKTINVLVVDGEIFDWGMDPASLDQARKVIAEHNELTESVTLSVLGHFCECFSDFIGKTMSLDEINESIEKGYVEC